MQRAHAAMLPDGRRLHLQHGPIDLIVEANGPGRDAAYTRATFRFGSILDELVAELPALRSPLAAQTPHRNGLPRPGPFAGTTARRMGNAVRPFADFITPMAAVAGAVADEILAEITADPAIRTAYVNNGGDVALHLAPGESFTAAVAASPPARATITREMGVGGMGTSGWGGRTHSFATAGSVPVLARSAAAADAAATLIANAVDLPDHPGIRRVPACDLSPDSDLGDRPVTTAVPVLTGAQRRRALNAGLFRAQSYRGRGLIAAAWLVLQGETRATPHRALPETADA